MKHRLTSFEHLVSTTAKKDSCAKCHAPTWTMWVDGILTNLDVESLDLVSEIQARMAGRRTYQVRRHDQGFRASVRHHLNITAGDHDSQTILASHDCQPDKMIAQGHPNYFASRQVETFERPPF
jgi:hypothetical protein